MVPDGTLLFHLAIIAMMVGLLNITLLKPITRILDEREKRTRGRFTEAETIQASVSQKLREYEQRVRAARSAGYALLEQQRVAVSQEREQEVSELKAEVAGLLSEEKEKLGTEMAQVSGSLANDARTRALEIGSQILGRQIPIDRLPGNEHG